jgi:hypothetical protein
VRPSPDALVESVLVLKTLGAPERRLLSGRKPKAVTEARPEPVPTSRATVVRATPFASPDNAAEWLAGLRGDAAELEEELAAAVAILNRGLRAHRVAKADPYVTEVSAERALVVRIGYGSGEEVAEGRFGECMELPPSGRRRPRRSMEAPEERFAALLGGREEVLPAEELVLRARADLTAGRLTEAALQARVAIEALLAAVDSDAVAAHREAVADAANAALRGELPGDSAAALEDAVTAMELALKRRRLGG